MLLKGFHQQHNDVDLDFFIVFNKISFSDPEVQDVTHRNTKIMYFYFSCTNYSFCHKVWSYCTSLSDDRDKHTEEAGGCTWMKSKTQNEENYI